MSIKVLSALSVLSSMVQPDRQSQCATHTHPLCNPATVTFNLSTQTYTHPHGVPQDQDYGVKLTWRP